MSTQNPDLLAAVREPLQEDDDLSPLEEGHAAVAPADDISPMLGAGEESGSAIHRAVWKLAWPAVTMMLLQTVNSMMDVFFVGHLPNAKEALSATGVGGGVIFLLIAFSMGVTVGTAALVARFTGAEDHDNAVHATGQSLSLGFLLAIVLGTLFYFGRGWLVRLMLPGPQNAQAARLCVQFLGIAMTAVIPLFVANVCQAAFRGIGNTRTPMLVTLAVITTHITFNALLIYGRLGFPRLGVRGAGTALALSLWVGATLFLLVILKKSSLREALLWKHLRLRMAWIRRILKIGIPAALQAVIRTLGMMSFTGMLARTAEGAAGVAALQIGIRAESIAFMPGFGYSMAAAALVGQSLGAKDPERAERCGWAATGQAIVIMTVMAVLFFTLAGPFAGLFTSDALVRQLGAQYLQINAFCEPFLALGMVLTGALQGAGDTIRPTYITFFTFWVVRMPLAYWLMFTLNMHTQGAWLAMCVTTFVGGVMTVGLWRSGKWKRIKV
jgi:putative MATE family efflux protein